MTSNENIYFELKDSGDFIRIELMNLNYPNAELDWDKNWIASKVIVNAGGFSGQFECDLMTTDFEKFKQSLSLLYNKLDGLSSFDTMEGQVEIKIKGDGIGHFEADCSVMDDAGMGNKLDFKISFDQTIIPELVNQLNDITKAYPISGDLKIKNE
mgnify:CR=1 FL=1|tara:strand:+ start:571 stop:1035 length:465 start_codon:yes stop_codon:yes gene_type:complete